MPETNLNERQQKFVREWLLCMNATEAAKKVGYSTKTAYSQGQRLLKNVEVQGLVSQYREQEEELVRTSRIVQLSSLCSIRDQALKAGEYHNCIAAIKEINAMMGWYKKTATTPMHENNPFEAILDKVMADTRSGQYSCE